MKHTVVAIGEILWDILPNGKELGGAPTNFAFHCQNQGAISILISGIGNDAPGSELKEKVKTLNLNCILSQSDKPTGTVSVELKNAIPNYTIHENVAWDNIVLNKTAKSKLRMADALCFGTLAQRSECSYKTINKAIELVPNHALKVYDINLRQQYYNKKLLVHSLERANVLKLNDEELLVLNKLLDLPSNQEAACKELRNMFNLHLIALTKGSEGSLLITANEISEYSSGKVKVVDTVGAGDSFTACMVMGLLNKKPLKQLHQEAADYAAQVCMHKGATPIIKPD